MRQRPESTMTRSEPLKDGKAVELGETNMNVTNATLHLEGPENGILSRSATCCMGQTSAPCRGMETRTWKSMHL